MNRFGGGKGANEKRVEMVELGGINFSNLFE